MCICALRRTDSNRAWCSRWVQVLATVAIGESNAQQNGVREI